RFLLPPAETDTAGPAGRRAACQAATAVGLTGGAVEPDYITHATFADLLGHARAGQQGRHGFGLARGRAGLEPGKHLVHECVVVVDLDTASTAEAVADAIHEFVLGTGTFDLGLGQDHHPLTLLDVGRELARFFDARLHAATRQNGS